MQKCPTQISSSLTSEDQILISISHSSQTLEQGKVSPSLKKRLFTNNDGLSFHVCDFDYIL